MKIAADGMILDDVMDVLLVSPTINQSYRI